MIYLVDISVTSMLELTKKQTTTQTYVVQCLDLSDKVLGVCHVDDGTCHIVCMAVKEHIRNYSCYRWCTLTK